jgi:Sec-independent protein secretion pathway component TatC
MRLRLSRDAERPIQGHLDELAMRGTAVLFMLSLSTVVWWILIDPLLSHWLSNLSLGAAEGTVSIYDPHGWMGTRWSMIGLLALLTTLPLAAQQMLAFTEVGLLPSERKWLRMVTIGGVSLGLASAAAWWVWGYPEAIARAGVYGGVANIGAQYDASALFEVGIGISWWLFLLMLSTIALALARFLSLVSTEPFDPLRVRVHGTLVFIWWLAAPTVLEGVWVSLAVLLVILPECVLWTMPRPLLSTRARAPVAVFDGEGDLRRRMFAMCACEDACPRIARTSAPARLGWVEADALCLDPDARDALLDAVVRHEATDLAISGCDGTPLPVAFRQSLASAGCAVSGLGWLDDSSTMEADLLRFSAVAKE